MAKMNQSGTDLKEAGESGEKVPSSVKSRDSSGERKEGVKNGIGMGKADSIGSRESGHIGKVDGRTGEMNDGNKGERHVYHHQRHPHDQND